MTRDPRISDIATALADGECICEPHHDAAALALACLDAAQVPATRVPARRLKVVADAVAGDLLGADGVDYDAAAAAIAYLGQGHSAADPFAPSVIVPGLLDLRDAYMHGVDPMRSGTYQTQDELGVEFDRGIAAIIAAVRAAA